MESALASAVPTPRWRKPEVDPGAPRRHPLQRAVALRAVGGISFEHRGMLEGPSVLRGSKPLPAFGYLRGVASLGQADVRVLLCVGMANVETWGDDAVVRDAVRVESGRRRPAQAVSDNRRHDRARLS